MKVAPEQFNSFTPSQSKEISAGQVATVKDVKVTYRRQKKSHELEAENEELRYDATHDPLTGALNRRGLKEYLATAKAPKAIIRTDVTNFKVVNDKYGEKRGDELIKANYALILGVIRPTDVIARPSGDDFVIILNGDMETKPLQAREGEEKRTSHPPSDIELINITAERIGQGSQVLLDENPELRAMGVDIAVGGAVWQGEESFPKAEQAMKVHKEQQHEAGGRYRNT